MEENNMDLKTVETINQLALVIGGLQVDIAMLKAENHLLKQELQVLREEKEKIGKTDTKNNC